MTAELVGVFGTVQSKCLVVGAIQGLIHEVYVLPPSSDSQTSVSHALGSMTGSIDVHSTLTTCPG